MRRGVVLVVLCASSRAFALDPPFGARGQVVITQNLSANVTWTGHDYSNHQHLFSANFDPSIDWFAFRNVSFGADAHVGYVDVHGADNAQSDEATSSASLGLRVGANLPFSRWVSLWPRATVYFHGSEDTFQLYELYPPPTTTTTTGPELTLYVPLLFHLRSHFFIGFGPVISHSFNEASGQDSETTLVAFHSMLGGTIGGERSARDDEVPVPWKPFGEEHETALDGYAALTNITTTNGGPTTWSTALSVNVDHFVLQHLSLGVGVTGKYSNVTTAGVTQEEWSVSLAPSVGYDVPISPRFSFYPRAFLGFGASGVASSGASGVLLEIYVSAYAPILVHPAPHFFVGFGPTVTRDLAAKNPRTTANDLQGTRVGAALSVGGWL